MANLLDALFHLTGNLNESGLRVMDSAIRAAQATVSRLAGPPSSFIHTKPPVEGPPDIDTATADFAERAARIAQNTRLAPDALVDSSRLVVESARKSFARVGARDARSWLTLPLQLPLSFATLLLQQGVRGIHASRVVGWRRFPSFMRIMMEAFSDIHVYVSLQYKEELERYRKRVEGAPDDCNARLQLGRTYIKCGLYKQAAAELSVAARSPQVRAQALYESTVANCRAGNYRQAVDDGIEALRLEPDNERARFWLWLTAQKLGGYPEEVPDSARMDMKVGYDKPTVEFEDIASSIGLDKTAAGRGIAVLDFDGDGYLDVVIAAAHGGCNLYRKTETEHLLT